TFPRRQRNSLNQRRARTLHRTLRHMIAKPSNRRDQQPLDLRTQDRIDRPRRIIAPQQIQKTSRQKQLNLIRRLRIELLQHRSERLRTKPIDRPREMRRDRRRQSLATEYLNQARRHLRLQFIEFSGVKLSEQLIERTIHQVIDRRIDKSLRFLLKRL